MRMQKGAGRLVEVQIILGLVVINAASQLGGFLSKGTMLCKVHAF